MTNTQVLVLATTRNGHVLLVDDRLPGAVVPGHGDLALTGRLALAGQTGLLVDITRAWTVQPTGPDNTGELWVLDGGTYDTVPDATEDTNVNTRWPPSRPSTVRTRCSLSRRPWTLSKRAPASGFRRPDRPGGQRGSWSSAFPVSSRRSAT